MGPGLGFAAVVKADGYGHGAPAVARVALASGADLLAVTDLNEALALRAAGLGASILITGPVNPARAGVVSENKFSVMVDNPRLLRALSSLNARRPVSVQIEVDLGLGRWGVGLQDLPKFYRLVEKAPGVRLDGIYAHPGYVAGKNGPLIRKRLAEFCAVTDRLFADGRAVPRHVANSALLLDFPKYRWDGVRVGNLLYGIHSTPGVLSLQNPWRPLSKIVRIGRVQAGQRIGYGSESIFPRAMTVGTIPVGYGHGLTLEPASVLKGRRPSFHYWGMVRGVRCPFIGKPGMNHVLVDLSGVAKPREGEEIQMPLRRTAAAHWPKVYLR
ncbi:MAG: alanine racemase [Elusimicrobia bacterium]|nr:alanine racemase [Elusimicrobiota bacterium]